MAELSLFELTPLKALEEVSGKLKDINLDNPDVTILETFAFHPGKPGLFTVWTDLDLRSGGSGSPNNRGEVIKAVHDLLCKCDVMLDRPACQGALGKEGINKYRAMRSAVSEKWELLKDALLPLKPQPLLSALHEVKRRLNNSGSPSFDLSILDTFAFYPGKPGLFPVWTDLDLTGSTMGNTRNRGEVINAIHDLLSKCDHMLERPACQKALGAAEIEKHRAVTIFIKNKLGLLEEAFSCNDRCTGPSQSEVASLPLANPSVEEQKQIDTIKRKVGSDTPIYRPRLFSKDSLVDAGAMAGVSMMVAIFAAMLFHAPAFVILIVCVVAIVLSFVRRYIRISSVAKRCDIAEKLYLGASTSEDILNLFPTLTSSARAQFLIGLGPEFREKIAQKHSTLKSICLHVDAFLSSKPDSPERANVMTNFPKDRFGKAVLEAVRDREG